MNARKEIKIQADREFYGLLGYVIGFK